MQRTTCLSELPNIASSRFDKPTLERLIGAPRASHASRTLVLFGSVRKRSYSRLRAFQPRAVQRWTSTQYAACVASNSTRAVAAHPKAAVPTGVSISSASRRAGHPARPPADLRGPNRGPAAQER